MSSAAAGPRCGSLPPLAAAWPSPASLTWRCPAGTGTPPVSLGAAAVAALAAAAVLFAGRWLDPLRIGIAVAAAAAAAAGLVAALAIAGQPFTALAAGACLGTAVTATVEAASRLPRGRWLADPPRPTTGHA